MPLTNRSGLCDGYCRYFNAATGKMSRNWLCGNGRRKQVEIVVVTIPGHRSKIIGTANGNIESFATGLFNTLSVRLCQKIMVCFIYVFRLRIVRARIELGKAAGSST